MAKKRAEPKPASQVKRNIDRPNGKAWKKSKSKSENGHRVAGRTKPSGHSVKGTKLLVDLAPVG